MKRSGVLEERCSRVNRQNPKTVSLSFRIVDRIHEVLQAKGLKQKDLAQKLGKSEAEVSRWMRGTGE